MRINPEDLIINQNLKLNNRAYYISGNDETYMKKTEDLLVKKIQKNSHRVKKYICSVSEYEESPDLFFESKIFILNNISGVDNSFIQKTVQKNNVLIIVLKNKKGDAVVKNIFKKKEDMVLFLCYQLDRDTKIKLLNFYKNSKNLDIDNDSFWYLVDFLDDSFVFFEKDIQKILLLKEGPSSLPNIKKTLSVYDKNNFEQLFFAILLKNNKIVNIYNSLILNSSDLHVFLQKIKYFMQIIVSSNSSSDAGNKFPKYLFKERADFIKIYNSVNKDSLKKIFDLIFKTEEIARKNNNLFKPIGLIFVLKLKKIISTF